MTAATASAYCDYEYFRLIYMLNKAVALQNANKCQHHKPCHIVSKSKLLHCILNQLQTGRICETFTQWKVVGKTQIEFITTISKHSMMNQSATPTSTQPDRPWRIMQA